MSITNKVEMDMNVEENEALANVDIDDQPSEDNNDQQHPRDQTTSCCNNPVECMVIFQNSNFIPCDI